MEFGIYFGCLHPHIAKQLEQQNLKFDKEQVNKFQELRENIDNLYFSELITERIADICHKKLFNQIKRHLSKHNKRKKKNE
jgi:hypothetical protein